MTYYNPIGNKPWSDAMHLRLHNAFKESMMPHANFIIVNQDETQITLQDAGPWDVHPTITNDAEWVVEQMARHLNGRRLFYLDSEGDKGELLIVNDKFLGFGLGEP